MGPDKTETVVSPMALLRQLHAAEFRTVAGLAEALGRAPQSVTRGLRHLEELGVRIISLRGRGHRLARMPDLLDEVELRSCMQDLPGLGIELLDECDSTNARLAAAVSPPGPMALVCEHQTAGRGRRGRVWSSGIGGALTFSMRWNFACPLAALQGLSLAVAVILARALERQGIPGISVKWPNDLLHQGRKLGGILIELGARGDARESVCIIGIGLNVRLAPGQTRDIDRPVTDLAAAAGPQGLPASRTALLAGLLRALAEGLPLFERGHFPAFRDEWMRRHAHQGQLVSIVLDGRLLMEGRTEGVAEDGALLLRSQGRLHQVHSGEVSLRIE